jgi:hypothetical protein
MIATPAVRIRRSDEQAQDGRATYPALEAYRRLLDIQISDHNCGIIFSTVAALLCCRHDISFMLLLYAASHPH